MKIMFDVQIPNILHIRVLEEEVVRQFPESFLQRRFQDRWHPINNHLSHLIKQQKILVGVCSKKLCKSQKVVLQLKHLKEHLQVLTLSEKRKIYPIQVLQCFPISWVCQYLFLQHYHLHLTCCPIIVI